VKQPWSFSRKTRQTSIHSSSVVGAERSYSSNMSWLIHSVPANVDPTERPASLPSSVESPAGPLAATFDSQSAPSHSSATGVRSSAADPKVAIDPMPPPGAMSKTSGPSGDVSAGRSAAS
jgi:hypothetical protein